MLQFPHGATKTVASNLCDVKKQQVTVLRHSATKTEHETLSNTGTTHNEMRLQQNAAKLGAFRLYFYRAFFNALKHLQCK